MYKMVHETRKFNTDNQEDMRDYDDILNDPLCSIINERQEKLADEEYVEGKLISKIEKVYLVVTWSTKVLS